MLFVEFYPLTFYAYLYTWTYGDIELKSLPAGCSAFTRRMLDYGFLRGCTPASYEERDCLIPSPYRRREIYLLV